MQSSTMPQVAQPPLRGNPPLRPPADKAQDIDWANEEKRAKSFEGEQQPGVFSAEEFASAGFYLPKQEARENVLQVYVRCWYCGVHVDEWTDGDSLLEEHIRHSRKTERVSDASCAYAQFRKQELRWKSGQRVCPRRESSRKEITRDFSTSRPPSTPRRGRGSAELVVRSRFRAPAQQAAQGPTTAAPAAEAETQGTAACPRAAKPPPPPPKPPAVLAPPSTPPLSAYAVTWESWTWS
jgi:Inhibitor of Apoptosis domain.